MSEKRSLFKNLENNKGERKEGVVKIEKGARIFLLGYISDWIGGKESGKKENKQGTD